MPEDKRKCFIVTPIGSADDPIRRHIDGIIDQAIYPALNEKYDIDVAHRRYEIGSINDRVVKSIYNADLVIANLTGLNPNVMYELAIRYSFGKPAMVIAEKGTKLPFDVIDENTIFYINDPAGANDLKNNIIAFESNIDYTKQDYGPVYKAIRNVALYREVESGSEVSNEKMLEYIITRLDVLENNFAKAEQVIAKPLSFEHTEPFHMVEFIFNSNIVRKKVITEFVQKFDWGGLGVYRPKITRKGFAIPLDRSEGKIKMITDIVTDALMDSGYNSFITNIHEGYLD